MASLAGGDHDVTYPASPASDVEVDVVAWTFVELRRDGRDERLNGPRHYGHRVATNQDPTHRLLAIASEPNLIELLAEMRISGLDVPRWELLSAPHRIELDPLLDRRLSPRTAG